MLRRFLLLVFLAPLFELVFLIWMRSAVLWQAAFAIGLASTLLGVWTIRRHGLHTVRHMQSDLQDGRPPAQSLIDGLCRFLAGVLLIVPSITTDLLGLALLFPLTRRLLQAWFVLKVLSRMNVTFSGFGPAGFSSMGGSGGGPFGGNRFGDRFDGGGQDPLDDSDIIDVDVVPTREPPRRLPR